MKIGIVCYPTHGGSGVVATELGAALAENGHSVHIISYAIPFRFESFRKNLTYHEVEVSAYPLFRYPPYDLALAGTIMEVAQQYGLDILHAHYAIPHAISGHLAREMLNGDSANTRLITTLHGTDITIIGQQRIFQRITRFGIRRSDGVTSVSQELKDRVLDTIDCGAQSIEVIPNFIDTERFKPGCCPDKRAQLAAPDEKIVVHVSNFREVKRPLDVVSAFAIAAREQKARLVMIGDGPELGACKELARELGIFERCTFPGTYDAIWELLPQADVFFLPSDYESFGLSALEAMACGVPVVASNTGGLPEVVEDGISGFLHTPGNVEAMAASIRKLLSDDKLAKRMGEAARERASSKFRREALLPVWEAYYEKVLSQPAKS
ncbi:MAG: N-acetyl-alpha-D-glucosaminyl L-malate synthase BshA [Planctomycetota bacterium]|nr:N-acetyl-alpha-D-glucosaminyl L-malate synthase BshA [Planctomycetota bacterium]